MLEPILLAGAVFAVLVWAVLTVYVLRVDSLRRAARELVVSALQTLREQDDPAAPMPERIARVTPIVERMSRDMILHTAADGGTPRSSADVLAGYMVEKWGTHILLREAANHRVPREIWRRTASMNVVYNLGLPQTFDLLARAVQDPSADVASVGLTLLGTSSDPRATDLLIDALIQQRHPASRVAVHLEHSPLRPVEAYRALLTNADPVVRFWGATLLSGCPGVDTLEAEIAELSDDVDPRVRKAAVQSLGRIGGEVATAVALRLLRDAAPFVRAHAARALAELECIDAAGSIAELLGDSDWWVRNAAKQSLEALGAEVWPVLVRCLEHSDKFVRNGAAEVFQNLGILDNLIVMEAASDDPSHSKIDLLRRIAAAGGSRMTESLVERSGSAAPRVRQLLATMGFEHAGAA
jgi:HEAT repeat protein